VLYSYVLCDFTSNFANFQDLRITVQAEGALRDLRYFSSTNNPRLVKKFLQMRIEAILLKIQKVKIHPIYVINLAFCAVSHQILTIFRIYVL